MSHEICVVPTLKPGTYGEPPILVASDKHCSNCNTNHDFEKCPECEADVVIQVGANYLKKFCESNGCEWEFIHVWED